MLPDGTIFEDEDFEYVDENVPPWDVVDFNSTTAMHKLTNEVEKTTQHSTLSLSSTSKPTTTTSTEPVEVKATKTSADINLATTDKSQADFKSDQDLPFEPDYYNSVVTNKYPESISFDLIGNRDEVENKPGKAELRIKPEFELPDDFLAGKFESKKPVDKTKNVPGQKIGIRDIFLQRMKEHEKFQKTQHAYQPKNDTTTNKSTFWGDDNSYLNAVNNILSTSTSALQRNSIVITPNKRRNPSTLTPAKKSDKPMKKSDLAKLSFFLGPEQFASDILTHRSPSGRTTTTATTSTTTTTTTTTTTVTTETTTTAAETTTTTTEASETTTLVNPSDPWSMFNFLRKMVKIG